MILWPAYPELPKGILVSGFQYGFADGRIRTEMSRGFGKSRGSSKGAPRVVSCSINLSNAQVHRVTRFWDEDTVGGNLWFFMPDPLLNGRTLEDETGEVIIDETGSPVTITAFWLVRFASGKPTITALGVDEYACNFEIDVRPL
jgi:hypothetical protein